jgi:predicted small secreted protein
MKNFLWMALLAGSFLLAGCHSGVVRGAGSDISKLGDHMQS